MSFKAKILLTLVAFMFVCFLRAETTADKGIAEGNGSVSGTVKDAGGAVLQGARIELEPTATTTSTSSLGDYLLPNVKPGTYTVTVTSIGFAAKTSTVAVTAGKTTQLD